MVKSSHHVSLFTLSRLDVYDYLRCPKIVSIKVHRMLTEPVREEPPTEPLEPILTPQVIGKAGDVATRVSFSPDVPEQRKELTAEQLLESLGIVVDANVRRLLAESLAGLESIKPSIEREYGQVEILGKGETRYGASPTYGMPDFVALAKGKDKPILVEVKNSLHPSSQDTFQAAFYNTMQSTVGVTVVKERMESEHPSVAPKTIVEKDAETVIVYPRLADSKIIKDTVGMGEKLVKGVWEAKQLGLIGKSPETACDSKCPHTRYGIELPEASIEPARPLPLIYAKGIVEKGHDPDLEYLHHFAWQRASPIMMLRWQLEGKTEGALRMRLAKLLAQKTGLDLDDAIKIMSPVRKATFLNPDEVYKEMSGEFERWEKLM